MECNFSNHTPKNGDLVELEGQELPKSDIFRHLAYFIHKGGNIQEYVIHRMEGRMAQVEAFDWRVMRAYP